MTKNGWGLIITSFLLLASAGLAHAASPPGLLNYQGVLRDINGVPLSGEFPMVFRLVDGASGNDILVDDQTGGAAGGGVIVTDGLFSVRIGSGIVSDGAGPGTYTSLPEVFRDFDNVLLSIEVNGEVLSPSIPIASAAYALNATHLDGLDRGQFLRSDVSNLAAGNIWFSGSPTGATINDATVLIKPITANPDETLLGVGVSLSEKFRVDAEGDTFIGGLLNMPNGAQFWDNGFGLQIYGGDADTDDVLIRAGNSSDDGSIIIVGGGLMQLRAGDGTFDFLGPSPDITLESAGHINLRSGTGGYYLRDGQGTIQARFANGNLNMGPALNLNAYYQQLTSSSIYSDYTLELITNNYLFTHFDDDGDLFGKAEWWHGDGAGGNEKLAELQTDGDFLIRGTYSNSVAFDLAETFLAMEPLEAGDVVSVDPSRSDAVRLANRREDPAVVGVVSTKPGFLLGGVPLDVRSLEEAWGGDLLEEYRAARGKLRERALSMHEELRGRVAEHPEAALPVTNGAGADDDAWHDEMEVESLALEMFHRERLVPVALAGRVPVKVDAGYGSIRAGDQLTTSPTPGHAMRADDPLPGTIIGKALEGLESGTGVIHVLVMLR